MTEIELLEKRIFYLLKRVRKLEFELNLYKRWSTEADEDIKFLYEKWAKDTKEEEIAE